MIQAKEGSEDIKKLTADQKVVRLLSHGAKTQLELKEELDIPATTLSSAIKKLREEKLIEESENKKYSLKSNPELEYIILQQCPFKNLDGLSIKLKDSDKLNEKKSAEQKNILEISIQTLEIENSIIQSQNGFYTLSDYGCIKIQHCIECRKKVKDGFEKRFLDVFL